MESMFDRAENTVGTQLTKMRWALGLNGLLSIGVGVVILVWPGISLFALIPNRRVRPIRILRAHAASEAAIAPLLLETRQMPRTPFRKCNRDHSNRSKRGKAHK